MSITAVAFLVASSLYTGFQWTIRIVVYPQFAQVGVADFVRYERHHQRLVSRAVGPLFLCLGLSVLAVLADPPSGAPRWESVLAVALVGAVLAITALAAVPLHRLLAVAFDPSAHRRLLVVDTARLVAAVSATVVAVGLLAG